MRLHLNGPGNLALEEENTDEQDELQSGGNAAHDEVHEEKVWAEASSDEAESAADDCCTSNENKASTSEAQTLVASKCGG